MSTVLINGITGSGKSHQAVKFFVVPNYAQGRNIRTNIKGLNQEEIDKYVAKHYPTVKPEDYGKIIPITDKDITSDNFYPELLEVDNKEVMDDSKSIIKSGDVIVIDEAAQFFRGRPSDAVLKFFTMHRHFTSDKGVSSEIALLVQKITLIHKDIRDLAKMTYYCKKQDLLGFSNKYYLGVYDGSDIKEVSKIKSSLQSYDKEIFPLYSSYAKGQGVEKTLDKRINLLKQPKFIALGIAIILCPIYMFYTLYTFFNPKPKTTVGVSSPASLITATGGTQPSQAQPIQSTEPLFKIVGVLDTPKQRLIFLQDQNKSVKIVYPQNCSGSGMLMTCKIDNKEISYYNNYRTGVSNENKNNNRTGVTLPISPSTSPTSPTITAKPS